MKLYTIGFTKTTAENFFSRLKGSGAKRLIDVRLNNVSQLAGFAKRDDLKFFAKAICDIEYACLPVLAPTQKMLDTYDDGFTVAITHRSSWVTPPASRLFRFPTTPATTACRG